MNYYDIIKILSINSFLYSIKRLFPTNVKNRISTNIVGLYHFLGASAILCGILAPPKYLYIHTFLICFILFTYYIFNDNCFVTLISNFLCEENTNPLIIPISKAKKIVFIILTLSITFYICPSLSFYNILFT